MDKAIDVFRDAEEQLRNRAYEDALKQYLRVVRGAPGYWRARFRIADVLLSLKAREPALVLYRALAWHAIKAGQPLEGLMAIKMASFLDPSEHDTVEIIAQMYSNSSDRLGEVSETGLRCNLTPSDEASPRDVLTGAELIETAAREASDVSTMGAYPDQLPAIPLFSLLDESAFELVLSGMQLRRFVKDQTVIEQGQPGDSFFILVEGDVEVVREAGHKRHHLARLHPGAVFGEMALISQQPRVATVRALEDCDLLELKRTTLEEEAHQLQSVTKALHNFTHDRFLANLTSTNAIFKPLPKSMRAEIIRRFQDIKVDKGDQLIVEGEEGEGLYLIIKGKVAVTKKDDAGNATNLATLGAGSVFGEISLIQETPTTASCTVTEAGLMFFLPKKEFVSTMARHPEMKDELSKITEERIKATKEILEPDEDFILIEDDDLIML